METITEAADLSEIYDSWNKKLEEAISSFEFFGSGWKFTRVEYLDIRINPFRPLGGSSYIKLPEYLTRKEAIINVNNEKDHECFKWSVTSAVYPAKDHPHRLTTNLREKSKNFDWAGIEFPMTLKKISIFEKQNPEFSVNVFEYEENIIYPLRISDNVVEKTPIDMFLFADGKTNHMRRSR